MMSVLVNENILNATFYSIITLYIACTVETPQVSRLNVTVTKTAKTNTVEQVKVSLSKFYCGHKSLEYNGNKT